MPKPGAMRSPWRGSTDRARSRSHSATFTPKRDAIERAFAKSEDNGKSRDARGAASDWCERGDSNPHGFPRQILSLVRLPIPPLSHAGSNRIHCNQLFPPWKVWGRIGPVTPGVSFLLSHLQFSSSMAPSSSMAANPCRTRILELIQYRPDRHRSREKGHSHDRQTSRKDPLPCPT